VTGSRDEGELASMTGARLNAAAAEMQRASPRVLDHLFDPQCVAVVGASATRGKWSNDVFRLLVHGPYEGVAVPVNSSRDAVEGVQAYPSVAQIPHLIDHAPIVVPRDVGFEPVEECVAARVPVVHVLSVVLPTWTTRGVSFSRKSARPLPAARPS